MSIPPTELTVADRDPLVGQTAVMGRRGRSQKFLTHWHQRELAIAGAGVLTWILVDDPAHHESHVECARITSADGTTRILHASEALELLVEHDHPDAEHVRLKIHVGPTSTH